MKLCECGCGQPVRRPWEHRFASQACVPLSVRMEGIRKGRARYIYRRRAQYFADLVARLDARVTRDDLMTVLMEAFQRGYNRGYRAGLARGRFVLKSQKAA